jgi:tRNA(Ile)-lysidine synthase
MPIALPDDALTRFREAIGRLTGGQGRIGLAVSGGGDSLALLLLAHAMIPDWVDVATVDHGLRPEAADEARFVGAICAELGLSHTVLKPTSPISGSLQTNARAVRYALLEEWANERDLAWIATAHHIEDQAETLMMRLLRGSGLAGLSAIRESNGRVIRPLLAWRRSELRSIVAASSFTPVDDRSNHDMNFDRVRMRQAFAENSWLDPIALSKSAANLAQANEALDWATEREAERRLSIDAAGVSIDPQQLPAEILRRLVLLALTQVDPGVSPRGTQISSLIDALRGGGKTELSGIVCRGGPVWHFASAPPRLTK